MVKVKLAPYALALLLATGLAGARAQVGTEAQAAGTTLREFAHVNPECKGFSDGCQICVRVGENLRCSSVGIACVSRRWACNGGPREATPQKADEKAPKAE